MDCTAVNLTTRDGVSIAGHALGDPGASPVLFLHGGGQTRFAWSKAMRAIAARGWRAIALDLRGHGQSQWAPDGDYRLETFADDLVEYVETLDQAPILVGASLGGLASIHYLGNSASRARALVLVDVVIEFEPEGAKYIRDFMLSRPDGYSTLDEAADAVSTYGADRGRKPRPESLARNLRLGEDGRYRWHWDPKILTGDRATNSFLQRHELARRARRIDVPVLLVRGAVSNMVSDHGVEHLRSVVPQTRVVNVRRAGHMVAGDQNDIFAGAVGDFLESL